MTLTSYFLLRLRTGDEALIRPAEITPNGIKCVRDALADPEQRRTFFGEMTIREKQELLGALIIKEPDLFVEAICTPECVRLFWTEWYSDTVVTQMSNGSHSPAWVSSGFKRFEEARCQAAESWDVDSVFETMGLSPENIAHVRYILENDERRQRFFKNQGVWNFLTALAKTDPDLFADAICTPEGCNVVEITEKVNSIENLLDGVKNAAWIENVIGRILEVRSSLALAQRFGLLPITPRSGDGPS